MPLPAGDVQWPPKGEAKARAVYDECGAWYGGDPAELSKFYASSLSTGTADGGVAVDRHSALIGLRKRSFWGATPPGGQLRQAKLHIPIAATIAAVSSDILFGTPPDFTVEKGRTVDAKGTRTATPTQARMESYLDDGGVASVLLEGGELAAAYGGVYLRLGWDPEVSGMPLWDAIPPDSAVPEWRSGRLRAVTFWRELDRDGGKVLRHLERHEPGKIWHGLYSGDSDKLGTRAKLEEHPETEEFVKLVNAAGYVDTGAKGLTAEYLPNMRPNRVLRGAQIGRSDFDGTFGLMDSLDEVWTSWLRDIRLGKGRLVVPSVYLTSRGRGNGATFDVEQEIFEAVDALPKSGDGLAMTIAQFAIRVTEHRDTAMEIAHQIVHAGGYSTQTFGDSGDVAMTATETAARERRTTSTRQRKVGYARPVLRRLARTCLELDVHHFKPDGVAVGDVAIEFPDVAAEDPQARATAFQMLRAADLMSIETGVRLLNPDWQDTEVLKEVERIRKDRGDAEPMGFPGSGTDAASGAPAASRVPAAART